MRVLKATGALGLLVSVSLGGNHYVKANTAEVYHVLVGDREAGIVSSKQVVEQYIASKNKELQEQYPDVHMVSNVDEITYESEKVFGKHANDEQTIGQLDQLITSHAVGIEVKVDGKAIAVVKDEATATAILDRIKAKYVPQESEPGEVKILSANSGGEPAPGESKLEKAFFSEKVEFNPVDVEPDALTDPEEVVKKLETGDVKPTKYTVGQGDCVSCIAKQFNISKQVIYENNPWIVDDFIKIGQQLDLTVLQPALTVETVEKVVENQEIQYDTIYETDDSMKLGEVTQIKPGKNGMKKVTFRVTKQNGKLMEEELVDEQIVQEPVSAVAKKGTKVVRGEGSGKFAYPVLSAKMTSSFGMRWGKMHKGIDLVSSNRNILAADNGKVVFAGEKDGYGNCIIIDHLNGYQTLYGHLNKFYTTKGAIVEKGEKIGYMGDTGDSTGVHLHFEIQRAGNVENPMKYLNR